MPLSLALTLFLLSETGITLNIITLGAVVAAVYFCHVYELLNFKQSKQQRESAKAVVMIISKRNCKGVVLLAVS